METLSALVAPLWGKSNGFPSQGVNNVELWYFLCCQPQQSVEQTVELPMIWDTMVYPAIYAQHQNTDQVQD